MPIQKYSVLMSVYAKENPNYFRIALDSIINQTCRSNDIVIVEDGPLTNKLYEVIDNFKLKYPSILKIVINKQNLGLGLALQKGLNACENELVARMDTDDIARQDRCEKQLFYLNKHPEVSIVGGQIEEFIDSVDNFVGKRIVPTTDTELKQYIKKRCPFNHMTVMFRKTHIIEAGNYQTWFWNEDYYLWIRLALLGKKFGNLPETLVDVRVGKNTYKRRGGMKYFRSEARLQEYMLKKKFISCRRCLWNILLRFIVQVIFPNGLRGWLFRCFTRKKVLHE